MAHRLLYNNPDKANSSNENISDLREEGSNRLGSGENYLDIFNKPD
jgi:hypothetical protein